MIIKKNKEFFNMFDIKGMSRGKLIAILNVMEKVKVYENTLTPLQDEVKEAIENALKES